MPATPAPRPAPARPDLPHRTLTTVMIGAYSQAQGEIVSRNGTHVTIRIGTRLVDGRAISPPRS